MRPRKRKLVLVTKVAVVAAAVATTAGVAGPHLLLSAGSSPADAAPRHAAPRAGAVTTASTTAPEPPPPSVPVVQRTLRALGYQVRKITGELDAESRHAVVAFQKVQGLPRSGRLDTATVTALEDPATPEPTSSGPGFHIEVDLGTQVAYTVRDGEVRRIYDASTGREPDKATPTGSFTVQYQIDGMRYAPLGPLYRPSYFTTTGIAFHGGEPVRSHPASNGCVRLTDPSVDELFGKLRPGTRVIVHQ